MPNHKLFFSCTLLRMFLAAALLPISLSVFNGQDSLQASETRKERKKSSKKDKKRKPAHKALLPKSDSINWNSVKEISPGIRYTERKISKPRETRFHFVRVDLRTPGLAFRNNGRAENWGKPMPDYPKRPIRTKRVTVREFFDQLRNENRKDKSKFNGVLAVNASPWGPWTSPFTHTYADPPGVNICNGEVVSRRGKEGYALIVYKDGKVDLKTVKAKDPIDNIQLALSGFAFVLRDGEVLKGKNQGLAPRTGYGISEDKNFLYIIVVDGRQPGFSMGTSTEELGHWLKYLGASDGINMDGGGSSTLVIARKKRSKGTMVNHQPGGGERKVATVLAIGYEEK